MNVSRTLFVAVAAVLSVAACSGGSSGDSSPAPGNTGGTPVSAKTTPGVWQGTVTSPTTGQSSVMGLTNGSGHSVWMTTDGRVWSGQMPMSGTQFNATMAGYMYPGNRFPDGSNHGMTSMTFHYGNGAWTGQYSGAGDTGTFNMAMNSMWGRPASLDTLAGTYTRTTSIGYTMTMSITQTGELTASDSRGCLVNGTVTVPDPTHNLYQLDATVTSCGVLDGVYRGHGTLLDAAAMQNWMTSMGAFQYGQNGMMGGGGMGGGMMGGWWPKSGTNTIPGGTNNLFMFAMTDGRHAIMDALAR